MLGDNEPDEKFRMWAIEMEDFVSGVLGDKWREAMRWASEQEHSLGESELGSPASRLECVFGSHADQADQIDDLDELNNQM